MSEPIRILLISDSMTISDLSDLIPSRPLLVDCLSDEMALESSLNMSHYDVLLIDLSAKSCIDFDQTNRMLTQTPSPPPVLLLTHSDFAQTMKFADFKWLFDYCVFPIISSDLLLRIERLIALSKEIECMIQRERHVVIDYMSTTLSHEINNPLTAIIGYSQMLLSNPNPSSSETHRLVETIEHQAHRIKDLTRRLQQMKHVEIIEYLPGENMLNVSADLTESKGDPVQTPHPVILVADDEQIVRVLLRDILESQGLQVIEATCGKEALVFFQQYPVQLVLLDLKLPDISGIEALQKMKQLRSSMPVIMITGYLDDTEATAAIVSGADGCLFKPFQVQDVQKLVSKMINPSRA